MSFPSGELNLEGEWHLPQGQGPFPAVVVCHPHPLYGGSMNNNVVYSVCLALTETNIAALRFNFRGVEGSQGSYDSGEGEADDIAAALSYIGSQPGVDPAHLGLCGYSFGAGVALRTATGNAELKALALVSLPLQGLEEDAIKGFTGPKLLVSGDADLFSHGGELEGLLRGMLGVAEWESVSGADHFWGGYEGVLSSRIARFFSQHLL
ncbi:MAG: dienelactone hydrolase family protein [Dehalococcoidia bacterium]|nr:dienelactone hydrolase family protein [Dehalococcoidia bacterium]